MSKKTKISKEDILLVAIDEFAKSGYALTTTDTIVKAAGISVGSLYNHFKNKQILFEEAIIYSYELANKIKIEVMEEEYDSEFDRTKDFMKKFFTFFSENKSIAKLFYIEFENFVMIYPKTRIKGIKKENENIFLEELAISLGKRNKKIDSQLYAYMIVGGFEHIVKDWLFHPEYLDNTDVDQITEKITQIIMLFIDSDMMKSIREKIIKRKEKKI